VAPDILQEQLSVENKASMQASRVPNVCICICTYKRPDILGRLLDALKVQKTEGRFTCSILVVDNDKHESGKSTVERFASENSVSVKYLVEQRQNIALARNKAVANAEGEYLAFIDDDEIPPPSWLLTLFCARERFNADGALGPVKPQFDNTPPDWIIDGKFYERRSYPTGFVIDGPKGRTGNVILKKSIFDYPDPPFRPEFITGEDQDFFRRMIEKGHVFIWCDEAVAYEVIPPVRWSRRFMLKRALLRGEITLLHPSFGAREILKSVVAVPLYAILAPLALSGGQGKCMLCLVKMCDHLGKLLALVGIHPVKRAYVTE
jgi:glycosyltransferase involved in cell wall biosynthesis